MARKKSAIGVPEKQGAAARRKRRSPGEIRERLLEAAREEFMARGYAGATTAAISRRAEVAEIQMFRYFPTKLALIEEAVLAPLKEHFSRFNFEHASLASDSVAIAGYARQYLGELQDFLGKHGDVLVSLFAAQKSGVAADGADALDSGLQHFLGEAARTMASRSGKSGGLSPDTAVRIAFGALLGCMTYKSVLFPEGAADDAEVSAGISEFILAGIAPHSDIGSGS